MHSVKEQEQKKGAQLLNDMLEYLVRHEDAHTPFMDRWFRICIEQQTACYVARPANAAVGRHVPYGNPPRMVECLESCARFGKIGVWFVRVVAEGKKALS